MNRFTSLLLPLDGSPEAAKGAGCALWLAHTLDATLHVLHASTQPLTGQDALARLRVPAAQHSRVVLHQLPEHADAAVLEAIAAHGVDLVVMGARGESASAGIKPSQRLGTVAQAVIERSPVPVLLLPLRYREVLPWTSMLAAASGEAAADQALETAAQLAAALRLKVTVAHAADSPGGTGPMASGLYADAAHHEYPSRIDEMVERGLAGCTPEECGSVDRVLMRQGDPATVLLELAASRDSSVLALGWHGTLGAGRALVLKRLLEEAECALLLVRRKEQSTARLKVGEEIDR
jgi:nucleotide-binding universal stress UspA family protein